MRLDCTLARTAEVCPVFQVMVKATVVGASSAWQESTPVTAEVHVPEVTPGWLDSRQGP